MKCTDEEPKAIAMYLPQFHNVEENNKWWGEGFTDWWAMENAEPLFENHKQPKRPLNNYKYDLLDKSVMQWQAQLMHKYGIYGLSFYHYWFKDGRRILEKPSENLLKWKDIDMPFCFYWANESWARSWSKISNQNVWAGKFEIISKDENKNGVLLEQNYGVEEDWIEHFEYLLNFFLDDRYIKINNKPIFIIYKTSDILCLKEMINLWNELAKQSGFDGIYLIGSNSDENCKNIIDAELIHEPMSTFKKEYNERYANKQRPEIARYLSYDEVWEKLLKNKDDGIRTYWSGFTKYDDTPRRGNAGTVVFNETPEKFKIYLTELYAKNAAEKNPFVFINAWNEWGEGMYLEPDEESGYNYLEAFPYAQKHYRNEMYKYEKRNSEINSNIDRLEKEKNRYLEEKKLLDKWLYIERSGKTLSEYFVQRGIKHIAIYGYGVFGKHLLADIEKQNNVKCDYIIDRNADGIHSEIQVFSPKDDLPSIEMVVITTSHIYNEIVTILEKKICCKFINIKEIVSEII